MHSIQIPAGELTLQRMKVFAEKYGCTAKWADPHRAYFEISSDDNLNFFWLGANMALAFTGSLDTALSQGPKI